MIKYSVYFATPDFYNMIRNCGGVWNDKKERPLVCLLKLDESDVIYWAVPMGNLSHRDDKAKKRLYSFINSDSKDIRSCYYHIGKTNIAESIFFISDAVPITDKYIDRTYDANHIPYVIKNPNLQKELIRKLRRILKYEYKRPNFFRQHITDVKNYLLSENSVTNSLLSI